MGWRGKRSGCRPAKCGRQRDCRQDNVARGRRRALSAERPHRVMDNPGSHKSMALRNLIKAPAQGSGTCRHTPRPQSDRAGLPRSSIGCARPEANDRGHMATHRPPRHHHQTRRMRELLRKRRVRFRQKLKRSRTSSASPARDPLVPVCQKYVSIFLTSARRHLQNATKNNLAISAMGRNSL